MEPLLPTARPVDDAAPSLPDSDRRDGGGGRSGDEPLPVASEATSDEHHAELYAAPVTTAGPAAYFAYDDPATARGYDDAVVVDRFDGGDETMIIRDAPVVPGHEGYGATRSTNNNYADEEAERRRIRIATQKGLIDADTETDEIHRQNRSVYAKNYYTAEEIKRANERAMRLKRQEDSNLVQTSKSSSTATATATLSNHPIPTTRKEAAAESPNDDRRPIPSKDPTNPFKSSYAEAGGGYQVSDYELKTEHYETSSYDLSEYKSVYDP